MSPLSSSGLSSREAIQHSQLSISNIFVTCSFTVSRTAARAFVWTAGCYSSGRLHKPFPFDSLDQNCLTLEGEFMVHNHVNVKKHQACFMLLLSRCISFRLSELQFHPWTAGKDSNLILDIKVDMIVHVFIRTMSLSIKPHHSVSSLTGTILAHSGSLSTIWKYFRFRASVTNRQQITHKESCRVASLTHSNKHQSNCHQCSGCLWLCS